jgi:2-polyprenyl-6-methoxyphenol hydroxylase-like FAD-dependent oxidoreductase
MKVLIVGAGIGGLTLAAFLKRKNIEVVVVEKGVAFRTIGYAIGIWDIGQRVLDKLGILSEVAANGRPIKSAAIFDDKNQPIIQDLPTGFPDHPFPIIISREFLHNAIAKTTKGIEVRFNTTPVALNQVASGVDVIFNDGSKEFFDLVVAADGIRSSTRDMVFGPSTKYVGWSGWVTWVDAKRAPHPEWFPDEMKHLSGKDRSVLTFNAGNGLYTIGFFKPNKPNLPDPKEQRLSHVKTFFRGMSPFIDEAIDSLRPEDSIFYDDLLLVTLKQWYRGRVVVVGDARHGMPPHTGIGASLVLEDAWVLSEELGKQDNIDIALKRFAERRESRVSYVQQQSALIFRVMFIRSDAMQWMRKLIARFNLKRFFELRARRILDGQV